VNPLCPYCGKESTEATGKDVYPHREDLAGKRFFQCAPCQAHVGRYADGRPLGYLANAETRRARMTAHAAFDPLWKSGRMTRTQAYEELARAMGIRQEDCHIGMFNIEECKKTLEVAENLKIPDEAPRT
jgi:hypothetical protein